MKPSLTSALGALAVAMLLPSVRAGERQALWPKGRIPDLQPHQYAALVNEQGSRGAMPYVEWFERPANPNGACMILVPGGGYACCGTSYLQLWRETFTRRGYQTALLVYRVPRPKGLAYYQSAWEDAQRAVRLVRSQAASRGLDPERIGAIGMSAGGHLVTLLATSALTPAYEKIDALDEVPCHLNACIANAAAYNTAGGGATGDPFHIDGTINELPKPCPAFKFDAKTCPISFHHGAIDGYTPNGATQCYRELRRRKIPAELHLYADLGHGAFGLERGLEFLRQINFDGRLGAEEDRCVFTGMNTAERIREELWPKGKMPTPQPNQTNAPSMTWFIPKTLKTKAVQIVFPGGGYSFCNVKDEGLPVAEYLNAKGMTVVVVEYRTPRPVTAATSKLSLGDWKLPKHWSAWEDACRAIRKVRGEAPARGLDPDRIGVMGFSAGGHLALLTSLSATFYLYHPVDAIDNLPCKVQWACPIYPAYALTDGVDGGNATGGNADDAVPVPEFLFDKDTPPMCFVHGDGDGISAMGSVKIWEKLRRMGVSSDLHTLATRGHCFQFKAAPETGSHTWLDRIWEFLIRKGFVPGDEIVVSPDGLSPQAALERFRAARKADGASLRKVRVRAGTYFMDGPLVLTPSDSGTPGAPVEWIGETGAVISVGCPVSGWRKESDGTWSAPAPKRADGSPRLVEQLWVNGRRAERSCYPKDDYFFPSKRTDVPTTNSLGVACWLETIGVTNEDVRAVLASLSPVERAHAQISVVDIWTYARRALMGYDAEKGEMTSCASKPWTQWAQIRLTSRLKIENVRAGFTAPGDWLYDGTVGRLRYRPRPGESLATVTAVADVPGHSRVLEVSGDPDAGSLVHDIVFRGVAFAHSSMMATDGPDVLPGAPEGVTQSYQYQAAHKVDGAVRLTGARRVRFEDCRVAHTGNYGMEFSDGCVSNAVVGCTVEDIGAGGIRMGSRKGHVAPGEKLTRRVIRTLAPRSVAFNEISDCVVTRCGRTNPEGPGVLLTHASDSRVIHCDIYDIRYSGVSVGWVWGYAGSVAQRNEIAYNRIWNLGQRMMADLGGVYTLGTSFGTHVHDNVIHDVRAYGYGGWGLYNDEGSEGVVFERNLVWNTTDGGYHQHFGTGNVVRNNIFAFNERDGALRTYRAEVDGIPSSVEVVNNIVLTRNSPLVCGAKKADEGPQNVAGVWCGNLWYDCAAPGVFNHRSWAEWQALGKEMLSIVADPCFVDADRCDFRLRPESPALKLGFKPWNCEEAGPRKR